MIYRRGRYYWAKFHWEGKVIRKSLRAEDIDTAREAYAALRRRLAKRHARTIEPERASLPLLEMFSKVRPSRDGRQQIFCDGSVGSKSAGFAWWNRQSDEAYVERRDGITSNEAEYLAVISALENLPLGSRAEVISDSKLCIGQLQGSFATNNAQLEDLRSQVKGIIRENELYIRFRWLPRSANQAGDLFAPLNKMHNGQNRRGRLCELCPSSVPGTLEGHS